MTSDYLTKYLIENGLITGKEKRTNFHRYYFDLDDTIADTSELRMHRKTEEGRKHISKNIDKFEINYYPNVTKLVNELGREKRAEIITNISEEYAKAVLRKGGFLDSIPVRCRLKKPCQDNLYKTLPKWGASGLVIGDSPIDILMAHGYEEDFGGYDWPFSEHLLSAGVLWANYTPEEKLRKAARISMAEPQKILMKTAQLEGLIDDFESGKGFAYRTRKEPHKYKIVEWDEFSPYGYEKCSKEIRVFHIGEYHKKQNNARMDDFSQRIMRFKDSRNFSPAEINSYLEDEFYTEKTGLIHFDNYRDNLKFLLKAAKEKIYEMNLNGKSIVIAAPEASPHYCYETDINHAFARKLNKSMFNESTKRFVYRLFPKLKGEKGYKIHLKTMGIKKQSNLEDYDNVIIFDDVYTSNSQVNSVAYLLRKKAKFSGNLYCLTLGKTARQGI